MHINYKISICWNILVIKIKNMVVKEHMKNTVETSLDKHKNKNSKLTCIRIQLYKNFVYIHSDNNWY